MRTVTQQSSRNAHKRGQYVYAGLDAKIEHKSCFLPSKLPSDPTPLPQPQPPTTKTITTNHKHKQTAMNLDAFLVALQ
jgi:hypothetical protein